MGRIFDLGCMMKDAEVVGNIFETPEPLKGGV